MTALDAWPCLCPAMSLGLSHSSLCSSFLPRDKLCPLVPVYWTFYFPLSFCSAADAIPTFPSLPSLTGRSIGSFLVLFFLLFFLSTHPLPANTLSLYMPETQLRKSSNDLWYTMLQYRTRWTHWTHWTYQISSKTYSEIFVSHPVLTCARNAASSSKRISLHRSSLHRSRVIPPSCLIWASPSR